jgi:hypothetical protein
MFGTWLSLHDGDVKENFFSDFIYGSGCKVVLDVSFNGCAADDL